MGDEKGKGEIEKKLDDNQFEAASEIGITHIGFEGVRRAKMDESGVRKVISRSKGHFIGFK